MNRRGKRKSEYVLTADKEGPRVPMCANEKDNTDLVRGIRVILTRETYKLLA